MSTTTIKIQENKLAPEGFLKFAFVQLSFQNIIIWNLARHDFAAIRFEVGAGYNIIRFIHKPENKTYFSNNGRAEFHFVNMAIHISTGVIEIVEMKTGLRKTIAVLANHTLEQIGERMAQEIVELYNAREAK